MPTLTALFNSRNDAEQAQSELGRLGISSSDISIHDQQSSGLSRDNDHNEGGFFDSLRDMFIPDDDSQTYGEGVRRGHVLLTVRATEAQADQVHRTLENSQALDADASASSWRNEGWSGPSTGNRQAFGGNATGNSGRSEEVIPIVEEQLAVGKREVNRGGVRVRSYVKETPVHEQVSLREEHVDVERRAVNEPLRGDRIGDAFQERTIEMTETAEEAVVAKNARVVEEVAIHKDVGSHVEQIDETVRRTDVDVERLSDTDRTSGERGAMFRDNDGSDRR
jgi:uncharacterized protein (TIGR02271 family)